LGVPDYCQKLGKQMQPISSSENAGRLLARFAVLPTAAKANSRVNFSERDAMTPEETHEKISSDATRFAEAHWRNLLSGNRTDTTTYDQLDLTLKNYGPLRLTFEAAVDCELERLRKEADTDPAALRIKLGISLPEPVQPQVDAMTPEEIIEKKYSSTITRLVEDRWRNLISENPDANEIYGNRKAEILEQVNNTPLGLALGTAFLNALTRELTRSRQEYEADPIAFRRRLGISLPEPVQPQESLPEPMLSDATKLAEARWRNLLTTGQRHPELTNTELLDLGHTETLDFQKMLERLAVQMGVFGPMFVAAVECERGRLQDEYDADRVALRRKLGISLPEPVQPQVIYNGSVGGMVVRTAIRATIWESVRALFRAFR
jgi:hypothetical protein